MPSEQLPYPRVKRFWYAVFKAVLTAAFRILTRLHVEGVENVPAEGGCILVINHLSYVDSPAMMIATPRHLYNLAAEKYEHHWLFGPLLRIAGSIFIQRGEVDRAAMRQAFNALEAGQCLALAIEGTRSRTGGLQPGKTGVAYFATRAHVPLIPVAIWGTEKVFPALARLRRAEVHLYYGTPFRLPEGRARSDDLDRYTEDIMLRIASLLPEAYRGAYRDRIAAGGR